MRQVAAKYIYLSLGWISLALGFIGAFLPIMPTTPFAILAAFLFSKGSPRLHQWLLNLPHLGSKIREWEEHKVIRPRVKVTAISLIIVAFSLSAFFVGLKGWMLFVHITIGTMVTLFILTRNSYPQNSDNSSDKRVRGGK